MAFDFQKLRELREQKGWSQPQASEASGIPIGTYRDLEQGKRNDPSFSTVQKLAAAFGLTCSDFDGNPPHAPTIPAVKPPRGRPKKGK